MAETHTILGDKVSLYRRGQSDYWQCATYLAGRNHRISTKLVELERAKEKAEEWYLTLRVKHRSGELRGGRSFQAAADKFMPEYKALTALRDVDGTGVPAETNAAEAPATHKGGMTAEGKARLVAALRKRWAAKKRAAKRADVTASVEAASSAESSSAVRRWGRGRAPRG